MGSAIGNAIPAISIPITARNFRDDLAPSGSRPPTTRSGDEVRSSASGGQTSALGLMGRPGRPAPSGARLTSPTLDRISSKMREVRKGERPDGLGPLALMHPMTSHKWAISRVDLVNFLHQAPTNAKDTGGKQFKENPPRIDRSEFATIVRPQQKQLENWVLSKPSGTQLDPADIYKKSLEINSGNPFLARLTVHNLMKDVTASSRNAGSSTPQIRERDSRIESRLLNLREKNDPNYSSDKMGPWYHMFGIAVADAAMLGGGRLADMVTPSNDRGKNSTDAWSVDAFSHKGK